MFPAVCVASIIIAQSRFTHPYYVLTGLVAGTHLVGLLLRWIMKRPDWESAIGSGAAVALTFELLSVAMLAGLGVFGMLFLLRRSHGIVAKG